MAKAKITIIISDKFKHDLCWDLLLRDTAHLQKDETLILEISDLSWANDLQLSALPFIISQLKINRLINVEIDYTFRNWFVEDKYFDYLTVSGFFNFMNDIGVPINLGKPPLKGINITDELFAFQSFKNIANNDRTSLDRGRSFLHDFSGTLISIFKKDIFENQSTAESLTRIIAKELVENINLHSNSNVALVRSRYYESPADLQLFQHNYSGDLVGEFSKNNISTPLFSITVSDNGVGIIKSLKDKYNSGEFIADKDETKESMLEEPDSWWLKRAFFRHKISLDHARSRIGLNSLENVRNRLGLYDVLDCIVENNGFIFLRSGQASAVYNKYDGDPKDLTCAYKLPDIAGTHYLIIFPAKLRKKAIINDISFQINDRLMSFSNASNLAYEEFDMSFKYKDSAIASDVSVSYKYPDDMIKAILTKLEKDIFNSNKILALDFSNAINEKSKNYIYIIEKLIDKYQGKIGQHVLIRNASDHLIQQMQNSSLNSKLKDKKIVIAVFNIFDRFSLLGTEGKVHDELISIYRNQFISITSLSEQTISVIANNGNIINYAHDGNDKIAFFADFSTIFRKDVTDRIDNELIKSGALARGHFSLNQRHFDEYFIAPLMFQNPAICRLYAKEIMKECRGVIPDILLTYSTTGIIIYYYLKNYYANDLKLMLVSGVSDLHVKYGAEIEKGDKVLILVDAKFTGNYLNSLYKHAAKLSGDDKLVILTSCIFDLDKENQRSDMQVKSIYNNYQIKWRSDDMCDCAKSNRPVIDIDYSSGTPKVFQKEFAVLSVHDHKRFLLNTSSITSNFKPESAMRGFYSRLDEEPASEHALYRYWKSLDESFQIGHVHRNDTHYEHYDIPENMLFSKSTLIKLEHYIKQYVWSFDKVIHYIIHPHDLTAAYLAHITASRFLKKPIVAEARKFADGTFGVATNIYNELEGKNVLLVDDSVNTGSTILELIGLVNIYGGHVEGLYTITNRMTTEIEMLLRSLVAKIGCAYRLHLDVFKASNCNLCNYSKKLVFLQNAAATKEYNAYIEQQIELNKVQPHRIK